MRQLCWLKKKKERWSNFYLFPLPGFISHIPESSLSSPTSHPGSAGPSSVKNTHSMDGLPPLSVVSVAVLIGWFGLVGSLQAGSSFGITWFVPSTLPTHSSLGK
jgi:hypothetical protein